MNIYKIELKVPKSEFMAEVLAVLPALSLTIESSVKLSHIGLMQFVRLATKDFMESLKGVTIYANEDQLIWNCYTTKSKLYEPKSVVLEMVILGEVSAPESWHYVAEPKKTMGYIRLIPNEEAIDDCVKYFYFDWQLPNIYLENSTDYDHDVEATGTVVYNPLTNELVFSFLDSCRGVACLSEFQEVKDQFKNMIETGKFEL